MKWFTADTHFGHANIIKHCSRPFLTIFEMDDLLLDLINSRVQPNDHLYHLGDFAFRGRNPSYYRERIRCKNVFLCEGNHDPMRESPQWARFEKLFSKVQTLMVIHLTEKWRVTLCHYPMRAWPGSFHGTGHLHGHTHGNIKDTTYRGIDIGVDCWNYRPISEKEVVDLLEHKKVYTTQEV